MKCMCGGKLVRIEESTYKCVNCDKIAAVAFASLPSLKSNYIVGVDLAKGPDITINIHHGVDKKELIKELEKKLANSRRMINY